jgi:hypothetical protein
MMKRLEPIQCAQRCRAGDVEASRYSLVEDTRSSRCRTSRRASFPNMRSNYPKVGAGDGEHSWTSYQTTLPNGVRQMSAVRPRLGSRGDLGSSIA